MADTGIIIPRPDKEYMIREDGVKLYQYKSENGVKIIQHPSGEIYSDAIDVENSAFTYTETDIPIEVEELTETEQKAAAWDELTGGGANE